MAMPFSILEIDLIKIRPIVAYFRFLGKTEVENPEVRVKSPGPRFFRIYFDNSADLC
jgi:hypothetical protein